MSERRVYLDHNATTPLHPEVKKIIQENLDTFGNPSSMHSFGREARKLVEDSRETTASFINASPEEIIFTGSGSEANNTVLSIFSCPSQRCSFHHQIRKQILTTTIEHPCVLETSRCLQDRGLNIAYIKVDKYAKIDLQELYEKINENT